MRPLLFIPIILVSGASAQYDIGFSGGIYEPRFRGMQLDAPGVQWNATMFYRERTADHMDLAVELQLASRELAGEFHPGVKGTEIMLQYLYLAILMEVRMTSSGNYVLRAGPRSGLKLSESFTGEVRGMSTLPPYQPILDDLQNTPTEYFRHEHSIVAGIGIRIPFGHSMALALDPYYSFGLNRILHGGHPGRLDETGIRIGLSRRFHQTGFTNWVSRSARRQREPVEWPADAVE